MLFRENDKCLGSWIWWAKWLPTSLRRDEMAQNRGFRRGRILYEFNEISSIESIELKDSYGAAGQTDGRATLLWPGRSSVPTGAGIGEIKGPGPVFEARL